MTKITQKLSYLFLATASLLSSVNGADEYPEVIERNCHACPSTEEFVQKLNAITVKRDRNEYELSAFKDYPVTSDKGSFKVTDVYEQPCFSNLGGFLRNWTLWFSPIPIPTPHKPTLKLPLLDGHFRLHETTKDTNAVTTCTYVYNSGVYSPTTYFQVTSCENKE